MDEFKYAAITPRRLLVYTCQPHLILPCILTDERKGVKVSYRTSQGLQRQQKNTKLSTIRRRIPITAAVLGTGIFAMYHRSCYLLSASTVLKKHNILVHMHV